MWQSFKARGARLYGRLCHWRADRLFDRAHQLMKRFDRLATRATEMRATGYRFGASPQDRTKRGG